MPWIVYKHTNKTSNKVYIGITKKTMMKRWYEHVSASNKEDCRASGYHFHRAIKKYGKDDWSHEVLVESIQTIEEASTLEIEFIAKYNSTIEGYNKTSGGTTAYRTVKKCANTKESKTMYVFIHNDLGIEMCTRAELCKKYNLNRSHLTKVIKGTRNHTGGWSISKEYPITKEQ